MSRGSVFTKKRNLNSHVRSIKSASQPRFNKTRFAKWTIAESDRLMDACSYEDDGPGLPSGTVARSEKVQRFADDIRLDGNGEV